MELLMRLVRPMLLLLFAGCGAPSTLGLPCIEDVHCDGDQVCVEGTCRQNGDPTSGTSTGTDSTDSSDDDTGTDDDTGGQSCTPDALEFVVNDMTGLAGSFEAVALADVDGDSVADFIGVNAVGDTVVVGLGTGTGSFAPFAPVAVGPDHQNLTERHLALADVNGDQVPDVVVTNSGDNTVSILHGEGDGGLTLAQTVALSSRPGPVRLADVDADGDADLLIARGGATASSFLIVLNDGGFGAPAEVAVPGTVEGIVVGHFDGDNTLDAAVLGNSTLHVYIGDGAGSMAAGAMLELGSNASLPDLIRADLDDDAIDDVVVVVANESVPDVDEVLPLRGTGAGTFALGDRVQIPTKSGSGGAVRTVALADFDGDGNLDVAAGHTAQGYRAISILRGDGSGLFTLGVTFEEDLSDYSLSSMAVEDLDGYCRPDIVMSGNQVVALMGTG
jgi:hypothetical protein